METVQPRNNPGPYLNDTYPVYLAPQTPPPAPAVPQGPPLLPLMAPETSAEAERLLSITLECYSLVLTYIAQVERTLLDTMLASTVNNIRGQERRNHEEDHDENPAR